MLKEKKLLILGKVWPEPKSSAAGSRMMQLIDCFLQDGWSITFASAANQSDFCETLEHRPIKTVAIKMNDSAFDDFVQALNPDVVLFDRFMTEEQFGWRVAEQCPDAVRVLDMEDLHCLRQARTIAQKADRTYTTDDLHNDIAKREIASIYRCDLSLVISEYEMDVLTEAFKIDESLLLYLPFMLNAVSEKEQSDLPTFEKRDHFVSIGNFLHEPNWDAVQVLKKSIWPKIRAKIPSAELHIYGAYPSQKVEQLHKSSDGFLIKGRAEDAKAVISNAKVLLAPLRIGAGLKGKLSDAMECGTPSITSSIGAEGMSGDYDWPGAISDDDTIFAEQAVSLCSNKELWSNAHKSGFEILKHRFDKNYFQKVLLERISSITENLKSHRANNFMGAMLLHHSLASTRFMSKWIEEKNK
tara:strand:- start:41166 stop:42404 length:1239 start_codon:yes stop_codon:yes gene_type:complete